ncbi:hypothetical protein Tco_1022787 [Tanacetum coccineum]
MKIKESLNVTFDETPPPSKTSPLVDDDLDEVEAIKVTKKKNLENDIEDETLEINEIVNIKESRNHPLENVIGNLKQRTLSWIIAMPEELNQFIANDFWELVPQHKNMTIIGTKWVFRNKLEENGVVSRNKARCDEFAKIMHDEFEMSMIEMLKKFGLEDSKPMKTSMSSDTKLTKDEECELVDSTKYQGMIGRIPKNLLDRVSQLY